MANKSLESSMKSLIIVDTVQIITETDEIEPLYTNLFSSILFCSIRTVNSSALAFALRGLRHRLASKYTSLFLSFINNNKFYHNQNMGGSVHRNLKQASVLLITQSPKINLKLTLVNAWLSFCAIYV